MPILAHKTIQLAQSFDRRQFLTCKSIFKVLKSHIEAVVVTAAAVDCEQSVPCNCLHNLAMSNEVHRPHKGSLLTLIPHNLLRLSMFMSMLMSSVV